MNLSCVLIFTTKDNELKPGKAKKEDNGENCGF